ncbi:UbiD family decarboxylase [Haladaptatus caseinilyticus]|uniref:UbiD family decarboxylase n=1 Tax=Haladaptatus caseinilyticus TaxID=2993314 RepID=UPI00224B14DA|nr:UbiD family decarboxylase [Haladaptatus caseinilyticus]
MSAESFRDYLSLLDAANKTTRISQPVSWNLEASALTMKADLTDAEIPIFENVGGQGSADARLVGDPYRGPRGRPWDRMAIALDVPTGLTGDQYYKAIIDRLQSPIPPTTVDSGSAPCKEVVRTGSEIDLFDFPWPYIHEGDGGRYSNLHTAITTDPDSEWTDWSYHRAMIHSQKKASILLLAGEQTPNLYYYKYERRNEPMPIAIALGSEPAVYFSSVMWIPTGRDEADFAGALKQEPIELVKCETNDLLVPASAEFIIEGTVLPDERLDEGPFGDYFGYMNGPRRSMPALEVDAITHRKRPYIPFCVEGAGVGHTHNSSSTMEVGCVGPDATLGLRAAGFNVEKCVPWRFTPRTAYTVSTENPRPGYLHELANFIFTTWGMLHIDFFVFVDSDIDPLDQRAVLEAITINADPNQDFHQFGVETMPKVPLNIYQTPEEKGNVETGTSKTKTAKAYIDATSDSSQVKSGYLDDDEIIDEARKTLEEAGLAFKAVSSPETSR